MRADDHTEEYGKAIMEGFGKGFADEVAAQKAKALAVGVIEKYKEYNLGRTVEVGDSYQEKPELGALVDRTLHAPDGTIDDKIMLTITNAETGEILFYGRNMYLRTAPIIFLESSVLSMDNEGIDGSMNFYVQTKYWYTQRKLPL